MNGNEVINYLEKYSDNSEIKIPNKTCFDYNKVLEMLKESIVFDCPDLYAVDKDTIYIFEHFEFDSSKKERYGSTNKYEIAKSEMWFKKQDQTKHDESYVKTNIVQLSPKPLIDFYISNLIESFNEHYKMINPYKNNILKHINKNSDYKFVVTFIIEETSIFGSIYNDKGKNIILMPFNCKDFMEVVRNTSDLDCIICSCETSGNNKQSVMLGKQDFSYFKNDEKDASNIKLYDLNPVEMQGSIFIKTNDSKNK